MNIQHITNEQALRFLRENKAHKEVVFIRPRDVFFGAFIGGELVGVSGYLRREKHIKLDGTFVREDMRLRGVATALTRVILAETKGKKIISYSRPFKARLNAKLGFKTIRTLPNGTQQQEYYNEQ